MRPRREGNVGDDLRGPLCPRNQDDLKSRPKPRPGYLMGVTNLSMLSIRETYEGLIRRPGPEVHFVEFKTAPEARLAMRQFRRHAPHEVLS